MHGPSLLRGHLRQGETCAHTKRVSFSCALAITRFLEPYLFLAFRLNDGCPSIETLSGAVSGAPPARSGGRRQLDLMTCRFSQHTAFRKAKFRRSHPRRACVFSFSYFNHFRPGQKVCRHGPTRRWERLSARGATVSSLSDGSWEKWL